LYRFCVKLSLRSLLAGLSSLALAVSLAHAQRYVERQVRIPWAQAGSAGLDGLLVYVDLPGKHPLVVLTHGSARNVQDHALVSPWQQLPQALWFARRFSYRPISLWLHTSSCLSLHTRIHLDPGRQPITGTNFVS